MIIYLIFEIETTYHGDGREPTVEERLALPDVYLTEADGADGVVAMLNTMSGTTVGEVDYCDGQITYAATTFTRHYEARPLVPMPDDYTL